MNKLASLARQNPVLTRKIGGIALGLALLLLAAGLRLFSYLTGSLTAPFEPTYQQDQGWVAGVRKLEGVSDRLVPFAPLLLLLGLWLATGFNPLPRFQKLSKLPAINGGNWLALALLALLTLARLWPLLTSDWLKIGSDYDEGVHTMAARLFADGYWPYRDYLFFQPPAAFLGLLPAAWLGGSGPGMLWWARLTSVGWSAGAGWLTFSIGRRLGGKWAGLLAMLVLELDGIGFFVGHQVLLEWQLNFFSLLAVWAGLRQLDLPAVASHQLNWRERLQADRWSILAGIGTALATLTKLDGIAIGLVLLIYFLMVRAWRPALTYVLTTGLAIALVGLPFVFTGGLAILRQTVFFQILRSPDGLEVADRFDSFAFNPQHYHVSAISTLTVGLAFVGLLGWLALTWRVADRSRLYPLTMVAGWGSLNLAFFAFNATFFVHYYILLLPSLALASGGLAAFLVSQARTLRRWQRIGLLVGLILGLPAMVTQLSTLTLVGNSPLPQTVGNLLTSVSRPTDHVQSFDMLYNLIADRPLPRDQQGKFLIDSYGGLQYEAFGLATQGLGGLVRDWVGGKRISSSRLYVDASLVAQARLTEQFTAADLVVLDERGHDYTAPTTQAALDSFGVKLISNSFVTAYANGLTGARKTAREWITCNLPRNTTIWLDSGSDYLPGEFKAQSGLDSWSHSPDWYRQQGFNYLLLSSVSYARFYEAPGRFETEIAGYNQLLQAGHLATFTSNSPSTRPLQLDAQAGRLDLIALPGAPEIQSFPPQPAQTSFGPALTLSSYCLQPSVRPGQSLAVGLTWQKSITAFDWNGLKLAEHLVNNEGKIAAQRDTWLGEGNFLASDWPTGQLLLTTGDLPMPANLLPGKYHLQVSLYYEKDGKVVPSSKPDGSPLDLGEIIV